MNISILRVELDNGYHCFLTSTLKSCEILFDSRSSLLTLVTNIIRNPQKTWPNDTISYPLSAGEVRKPLFSDQLS